MKKYWLFWKRGWWAWLFQLCSTLVLIPLVISLAIIFREQLLLYWVSAIALWLVVGAPLWGWLFEKFAASSARLGAISSRS